LCRAAGPIRSNCPGQSARGVPANPRRVRRNEIGTDRATSEGKDMH
jgi:hypothetical protein